MAHLTPQRLAGALLAACLLSPPALIAPAWAATGLSVTYPSAVHQTRSASIFIIGTAPPGTPVTLNGQVIARSPAGHFGPTVALKPGENTLILRQGSQSLTLRVTRLPIESAIPVGAAFGPDSLLPRDTVSRPPGEAVWLSAVAPAGATVKAVIGGKTVVLTPQPGFVELPDNKAALTENNQPVPLRAVRYQGLLRLDKPGDLGQPIYQVTVGGRTATERAPGRVIVMNPATFLVAQVAADQGVARTGPSTDFSRMTPLPRHTRALVTGREGDWLRLEYGAWINLSDVTVLPAPTPPRTLIRSLGGRRKGNWTEVTFPLQQQVPLEVQQSRDSFSLTLYNTTAQTDIIHLDEDPLIDWLEWAQVAPGQVKYTFHLKQPNGWGYKLRYEGTSLVLGLRQPPPPATSGAPLGGIRIVLDFGHGGADDPGTSGPTGAHERDFTLAVGSRVRDRLRQLGAEVILPRESDRSVGLKERVDLIQQREPDLAVSLHYNALPDDGDVMRTQGIGAFWYNAPSQPLAAFMHRYLTETLNRPSYGVFWDNLAMTRPTVAPAVLLELGFLTNPNEFEWVADPRQQEQLATAIADGLAAYIRGHRQGGREAAR